MKSIRTIARIACALSAVAILTSSMISYVPSAAFKWREISSLLACGMVAWGVVSAWASRRLSRDPNASPPAWLKYGLLTFGVIYSVFITLAFIG